jgi:peptide/nickel transport system substrate-binding protein
MLRRNAWIILVLAALLLTPVLAGCGSATATAVPTTAPTNAATVAATVAPTKAATAAPAASATAKAPVPTAGPQAGGSVVFSINLEPDTLDPHLGTYTTMEWVLNQIGATLLARDPATGKIVPYLADSWKTSADGLTWDFTLKKGIKFHDGTPLTAADYAWTLNRAIDPATKSPLASNMLGSMQKAEALDDSTLRLTLKEPFYPLMINLAMMAYTMPLPRAAVEKAGSQFGRAPISVGPYKFKEWVTGDRIVVERNPDFNWRPPFQKAGPYIQTITFRLVPEYSTALSGLESGDIDILPSIDVHHVQQVKDTGQIGIIEGIVAGSNPMLLMNVTRAPFDDIRVRKAFCLAVDRQSLIKVLTLGTGVEQRGPMSPTMSGYSTADEKSGYGFDLAAAKKMMADAGYTPGPDGNLRKDGKTIDVTLWTSATDATVKLAEMLQVQYKDLGVPLRIDKQENATQRSNLYAGNFQLATFGYNSPDADILVFGMGGKTIGANLSQGTDANLDKLLLATRTTIDPDKRQAAVDAVVQYMNDQALTINLYATKSFLGINNRVKGVLYSAFTNEFWFCDAYIGK